MSGEDYRVTHMSAQHAARYENDFLQNPHRKLMWELEQAALIRMLNKLYFGEPIRHLDFACGTGRLLQFMSGRAETMVGVDVSESMLAYAREKVPEAEIIRADLTKEDVLGDRQFNLITAFRFFPNAQPELRREAMAAMLRHLAPGGYLIFNNHKNLKSLVYRVVRLLGRGGLKGMEPREVEGLLVESGMKVVLRRYLGILPATEKRLYMPRALLKPLERMASHCPVVRRLAIDTLYACARQRTT